jgi:hypothetical protein
MYNKHPNTMPNTNTPWVWCSIHLSFHMEINFHWHSLCLLLELRLISYHQAVNLGNIGWYDPIITKD